MSTALPSETQARAVGLAFVGASLHAVFALGLYACYAMYVPAAQRAFGASSFAPAAAAARVVAASEWVADHPARAVLALAAAVAGSAVVTWALARRGLFPVTWLVLVALVLVGTGAYTTYVIESNMAQMRAGANK